MITEWNIKQLGLAFSIACIAILSFLCPPTQQLWALFDEKLFRVFNYLLTNAPSFWLFNNSRAADWIEDIIILLFCIAAFFHLPKEKRSHCVAHSFFTAFYIAFVIFILNRLLFYRLWQFHRPSPSIILPDVIRLTKLFPSISIKDQSLKCFPGDHATTALLFASCYMRFAPKRYAIGAWAYSLFLCLPRLVAGAHWPTDILIGSGSITLIAYASAYYTPLSNSVIRWFENLASRLKTIKT